MSPRLAPPRGRQVALFVALLAALAVCAGSLSAQQRDTTAADTLRRGPRPPRDTGNVQGSIYTRPFIGAAAQTAIGGYAEGNTNYFRQDGVSDGFSMELRRFNIFLFSSVGQRLRFISELEFEKGTEEIALETALLDFQIDPALVLRAGIILPPIGAFNQNHDSPRWEFVDRPLVSTRIIPSTLSEVGFGALGRIAVPGVRGMTMTYDAYLTNGLGDGVILNGEGRTLLAAGKREEQFAEDNNGSPAISGRLALQRGRMLEVGLSYYGGIYNTFRVEGVDVDQRRRLSIAALDLATSLGPLSLRGEAAMVRVGVPANLAEVFGDQQRGVHVDAVLPVWRPRLAGLRNAVVNAALRLEYVDYNVGTFQSTGGPIRDDVRAIVPGISFRPTSGTVFKANYRREWMRDLLGNPTSHRGGWQVGFATYF
ncbi:MAG: hypothetical protein V4813_03360 [Gemmatimonadota bacterium]